MIAVVVIGLVTSGYFAGRNAMMKKQVELKEELNMAKIAEKNAEISEIKKEVEMTEKEIEVLKEDKNKLKEELEENEQKIKELEQKIKDAPPETLLAESRRILDTREIWLIDRAMGRLDNDASSEMIEEFAAGAEFSMLAFRKATWVFTDWENFTLIREPKYKEKSAKDDKIILSQGTVIGNLKISNLRWKEKYGFLNESYSDWKKYVKKKQSIWKWLGDKALTFGAGYFFGKLAER